MNCEQLNNVKLEEVLASLGHLPIRKNAKEAWFINPFFYESQASFKIDLNRNLWYLHSEGIGGTVIDFIKKYLNLTVPEVLSWANERNFVFSFHQQENKLSDSYTITQIRDLYSYPLKNYLKERGLTKTVWKYVKEIKFTLNQKKLFAIGFQNDSGGWELRNSFYKGSFLKKDITTGLQFKSDTINVFEGFMDFLSFEELFPENRECYLVLNSISMVEKSKQILQNFEHINLYLDNDQAGRKMTLQLKNEFSEAQNKSDLYQGFKDLNEKLKKNGFSVSRPQRF